MLRVSRPFGARSGGTGARRARPRRRRGRSGRRRPATVVVGRGSGPTRCLSCGWRRTPRRGLRHKTARNGKGKGGGELTGEGVERAADEERGPPPLERGAPPGPPRDWDAPALAQQPDRDHVAVVAGEGVESGGIWSPSTCPAEPVVSSHWLLVFVDPCN